MNSVVYSIAKSLHRSISTPALNQRLFGGRTWSSRASCNAKALMERGADHDALHDEHYSARHDAEMVASAEGIATSIMQRLDPQRVVDVGCGSGSCMVALRDRGVDVAGSEYADAALARCQGKGLEVRRFDLEREIDASLSAEVALSTEVAEHLPETSADRYVDQLCAIAPLS